MSLSGRLFPESIFPRKLPPAAERRVRLAQARAEESGIRARVAHPAPAAGHPAPRAARRRAECSVIPPHGRRALVFFDPRAGDMPFDRAIDSYVREMAIPEPLA